MLSYENEYNSGFVRININDNIDEILKFLSENLDDVLD